jgi:hypothetical protein
LAKAQLVGNTIAVVLSFYPVARLSRSKPVTWNSNRCSYEPAWPTAWLLATFLLLDRVSRV